MINGVELPLIPKNKNLILQFAAGAIEIRRGRGLVVGAGGVGIGLGDAEGLAAGFDQRGGVFGCDVWK